MLGADLARGLEALRRVARGHPDVDDRKVGAFAVHERQQPGNVLGLPDDVEAGRPERRRERLAEQDGVVGKDDPDRSSGAGHGERRAAAGRGR